MSYEEWAPPDSYWLISTAGCAFRTDEATANRVCDEYERGDKMLVFHDVAGGEIRVPAERFLGVWESTPETRARDNAMQKSIDSDGEQFG